MECWRLRTESFLLWLALLHQRFEISVSINPEGRDLLRFKERVEVDPYGALSNWKEGDVDPCSWFGVVCSDDGRVVALNLKDLCLKGKLGPVLGKFIHMKSLNLYNNSFSGIIPREIGELQKLEILNLGHNDLGEPLPPELGSISSLQILVLRNNKFVGDTLPEMHQLNIISEIQVDEELLSSSHKQVTRNVENATIRRLLQEDYGHHKKPNKTDHIRHTASRQPPRQPRSLGPSPPATVVPPSPPPPHKAPSSAPDSSPTQPSSLKLATTRGKHVTWIILGSIGGASFLLVLSAVCLLCYRANKVVTVMPWRTGLSGQLQKAFVTGVPSLRRSELEIACEDFSNIVGSWSDCTLYKGKLSSGIEIAVTSTMVTSAKDWLEQYEAHFRKKISLLSKINHKNFMNLLGYCEEEEPFTRMLVFEYAPNGTLFEHLHIKEAEQLDWAPRLRIAMGIVYCLEYMHQLNPPVVLRNLNSSSIYLTEDYAAKISELGFSDQEKEHESVSVGSDQESIVYKFGIILLEIISGRLPFSKDDGLLVLWASGYLTGKRPLKDMVDPTLRSVHEEDIGALCEVIRSCINSEPKERPTMAEVASRMRLITAMPPDEATPKLSPLWWAELEVVRS